MTPASDSLPVLGFLFGSMAEEGRSGDDDQGSGLIYYYCCFFTTALNAFLLIVVLNHQAESIST